MVRNPEEPLGTQSREQLLGLVQLMSFVCLCVCQNVLVLAEAGCLDPRIFCTSCMVSLWFVALWVCFVYLFISEIIELQLRFHV